MTFLTKWFFCEVLILRQYFNLKVQITVPEIVLSRCSILKHEGIFIGNIGVEMKI